MTKRFTFIFVLILSMVAYSLTGYAQEGMVRGTVYDADDGTTLPGASVLIKGTTKGTVTDVDGKFNIMVGPNTTLEVSFIGYKTQEVLVQPNSTADVYLESSATALDELVVIGYGVQKRDDATGSVTAIDRKEFNVGSITSPAELINGKIPGVQVVDGGGAPGEATTIRIRGGSSLQAINDPLIVIDGVPIDNDGISGMRNPLNTINPNDIESMTILKDASATAIYGSRASNGVIIVTTKKAKLAGVGMGAPLRLEYQGNFSLYTPTKQVDVYGADEFRGLIEEKNPTHTDMLGNASTDWQDEIFDNAFGMDHYVGASGAFDFMPYRFSVGYANKDGILKTDNMERTTLSLNLNPSFLDDHLKVNLNSRYMYIENRFADRGSIGAAIQFDPTKPVKSDTSQFGGYYFWEQANGNPVDLATNNPVAMLDQRKDISYVNRLVGNLQLDYKLHWLPELRANLNLGLDYSDANGNVVVDTNAAFEFIPIDPGDTAAIKNRSGVRNYYTQMKRNQLLEFYLNYNKDLPSLNSNIDAMVGYSWQWFYRRNTSLNSSYLMVPTETDTVYDPTEYYLLSYFGRINYTFMDRYLLTFTLRNDNTSRFSEDNRQGWFPSVALGWKINDEKFMQNVNWLSQLKLRLSYGITGQQNINQGDYPYLARYTYNQAGAYYQLGNMFFRTLRPEGYDENIKWEETTTWNAGLDYGIANNRYYGSIDFYLRKTEDLLNIVPVPAGTNLTNEILTNIGDLENKGVEFSIFTRPIVKQDMAWEVGLNATYNYNEITKLTASSDENYLGYKVGDIAGGVGNKVQIHSVGYPAFSYFVYEQVYDADGNPIQGMYVDRNGDGEITDDDRYHYKDPNPDVILGISSRFNYKSWDLAFSGRAYFGNYVYNNVASENAVYQRLYRAEGPYLSNISTEVTDTEFENPQYLSDYYVQDGSFFRMDYITLGYSFKNLIQDKLHLRLTATVNNVFIISQYKGLDPEIFSGIDNNIYPRPRTYTLGVNLQF